MFCFLCFAASAAPVADKVRLQLKWQHQFQFAGYYAAQAQGYYRDAGLEVEIVPGAPGDDAHRIVLAGQAEFGVGTTDLLLLREKGAPVVVLAVIFQHSPLALATLKRSGTQDLHGLDGQRLMIEPGSAELFAYLRREGLTESRFSLLPHGHSIGDLIDGKVDAMSVYTTDEPFDLVKAKKSFVLHSPRVGGIDFYGDNLFTTEAELKRHPARVRAFREASLKGWEYAMAHTDEIAELIYRQYSRRHSLEHLQYEARAMQPLLQSAIVEPGHMYQGRWEHIAKVYAELGLIRGEANLKGFLYDPKQPQDLRWVYWSIGWLMLALLAMFGLAAYIGRKNRQLKEAKATTERLLEDQKQFLRMISHEFRSPLAVIDSASQLLKLRCRDENLDVVNRIRRGVNRLSAFIDNCLAEDELQQIGAEGLRCGMNAIDLPTFLASVVGQAEHGSPKHRFQLRYGIRDPSLQADPRLLRILLLNLLGNACKYSAAGSTVTLTATAPPDSDSILLQVQDTGIGICPEDMPLIRKRYTRGQNTSHVGGAGLGLYLADRIVDLHQGSLTIESELNKGTCIAVRLPRKGAGA